MTNSHLWHFKRFNLLLYRNLLAISNENTFSIMREGFFVIINLKKMAILK